MHAEPGPAPLRYVGVPPASPLGRGSDALGEAGPGLHPASSARGSSSARPHRRGTNAPFDPFCEATSYVAGNGVCSVGSL